MIKLGIHGVDIYSNNGIMFSNSGHIIFRGQCHLGSGVKLSVHKDGILSFGNGFCATAELKVVCTNSISFGDKVLVGWENIFMDTNFHKLITTDGMPYGKVSAPICIGNECWFGFRCTTMPGTEIPKRCVIASNSLLNKKYEISPYSLLAGSPAVVKKEGVWKDPESK